MRQPVHSCYCCSRAAPPQHACRCVHRAAAAAFGRRKAVACAAASQHPAASDAAAAELAWPDMRAGSDATSAQSSIARDLGVNQHESTISAAEAAPQREPAQSGSSSWEQLAAAPAAPPQQPPEAPPASLLTSTSGFVWALAVLFSIRLSRRHTEQAAFNLRSQVPAALNSV